jgi:hypothetical protein
VIELTTFRLRAGVDEGDFVAADADAQAGFFYQQPGLVRRTTARLTGAGADEWLVVAWWGSADAADAAAAALADPSTNGAAQRYLGCLDGPVVRRYEPLAG